MSDVLLDLKKTSANYGDFILIDNDLAITPNQETAIQQHILQRLRTYLGEWFMDTTLGIDYFGQILIKNPDQSKIDALLRSTILDTPGVTHLLSYNFKTDFKNRILDIDFTVDTTIGEVSYDGVIGL